LAYVTEQVVWPEVLTGTALHSFVVPSKKVTVPVGTPTPGESTRTAPVTVSDWPVTAGSGDAVRVRVVRSGLTFSVIDVDAELEKLSSPE
jgi:hypothetical protein